MSAPIDAYASGYGSTRGYPFLHLGRIELGTAHLSSGEHELAFVMAGKNAASSGYGLGIDAISIERLTD